MANDDDQLNRERLVALGVDPDDLDEDDLNIDLDARPGAALVRDLAAEVLAEVRFGNANDDDHDLGLAPAPRESPSCPPPSGTRDATNGAASEPPLDDDLRDVLREHPRPRVEELWPEWPELFKQRHYIKYLPLLAGFDEPVILLGYVFDARSSTHTISNAQVEGEDGIQYSFKALLSMCGELRRVNSHDTHSLEIKVIPARFARRISTWRNRKRPDGTRSDVPGRSAVFEATTGGLRQVSGS